MFICVLFFTIFSTTPNNEHKYFQHKLQLEINHVFSFIHFGHFFKTLSEDDAVRTRGLDICLVSLAAGSPCPGCCTNLHVVINEINVRGGTGVGPPPVHLWSTVCLGTKINECLDWRVISGESEVEQTERKSGVDKWKMGARDGEMLLRIKSICICISVYSIM